MIWNIQLELASRLHAVEVKDAIFSPQQLKISKS